MDDPTQHSSQSDSDSDVEVVSLVPSDEHDEPIDIYSDSESDVVYMGTQEYIPHKLLANWITHMRQLNVMDTTKGIGENAAHLITWVIAQTIKLHWSLQQGRDYITWLSNELNAHGVHPNVPPRERDVLHDVLETYWANWAGHEDSELSGGEDSDSDWEED